MFQNSVVKMSVVADNAMRRSGHLNAVIGREIRKAVMFVFDHSAQYPVRNIANVCGSNITPVI